MQRDRAWVKACTTPLAYTSSFVPGGGECEPLVVMGYPEECSVDFKTSEVGPASDVVATLWSDECALIDPEVPDHHTYYEVGAPIPIDEWPVVEPMNVGDGRLRVRQGGVNGRALDARGPCPCARWRRSPWRARRRHRRRRPTLDNAARYAPNGPIEVTAIASADRIVVSVLDRGIGLPEGPTERLFERFWRAADGGRAAGSGLGLAIVAAIARVHGGRVSARPREGGGSIFAVELPIVGQPPREALDG